VRKAHWGEGAEMNSTDIMAKSRPRAFLQTGGELIGEGGPVVGMFEKACKQNG